MRRALVQPGVSDSTSRSDLPCAGAVCTDRELAALLRAGSAGALEQVWDQHAAHCRALARRMLRDVHLADDVVQEVFLTLWRTADRYDPDKGRLQTWLVSVTHHRCVDLIRRRHHRTSRDTTIVDAEQLADQALGPEAQALLGDRASAVVAALQQLSAVQRQVLTLAYFDGMTQTEIAARTGTPLGTVKTRCLAGLRKLRTILPDHEPLVPLA